MTFFCFYDMKLNKVVYLNLSQVLWISETPGDEETVEIRLQGPDDSVHVFHLSEFDASRLARVVEP